MSNYLADINGNRLSACALTVRPKAATRKIITQMLDGSHTVQQIGTAATSLKVTAVVRDKAELDTICATCAPIRVAHYGKTYTGIIADEAIDWEPVMVGDRWYRGAFEVLGMEGTE